MAKDEKHILLRIPNALFNQVAAKRDTIPGGMSFNKYVITTLHGSLQPPVEKKDDKINVSSKAMLHLLHMQVVNKLIRAGKPYNEALAMVNQSITTGSFYNEVTKALNEIIASLEEMQ